jgi:hypothetical protein
MNVGQKAGVVRAHGESAFDPLLRSKVVEMAPIPRSDDLSGSVKRGKIGETRCDMLPQHPGHIELEENAYDKSDADQNVPHAEEAR